MAAKKYAWGDKLGKVHSIPKATHVAHVKAKAATAKARQPLVPGSSITNRQANQQTTAAIKTQYGPLESTQRRNVATERHRMQDFSNRGGFYDQYLKQLAMHAANVNAIGGQANQAVGALPGQVTGLAQADLSSLQGQANAGAAARGTAPAGDLTPMASDAAATRQALTGSFAAQQAAQNAAAQTYADTLAHVVAPAQQLTGRAVGQNRVRAAGDKLTETLREKGAAALKYKEDLRSSESRNVLARQVAGIGAASKAATATETTRTHKANENLAQQRIDASQKDADRKAAANAAAPNKYGITNAKWAGMTQGARQQVIKQFNARNGSSKTTTPKVPTLSAKDMGDAMTQLAQLKTLAGKAYAGEPFDPKHKKGGRGPLSRPDAAKKILGFATKIKDPLLATAALDVIYRGGFLHPNTVKRLRAAGYDPNRVIQTLGAKGIDAPAAMPKVVTAPSGHGNQMRPT